VSDGRTMASKVTYLDSSALVKLVVAEEETKALRTFLRRRRPTVSSALARTEVLRAVAPEGDDATERARAILLTPDLVRVSDRVLLAAAAIRPATVRTLDAIHLATAQLLGEDLGVVVTYDLRLAEAAEALGLRVAAPG
jgi:uncharacterized protein